MTQLNTDEGCTSFAVVALEVLELRDVVIRAENIAEEHTQLAGLLREVHQEVVLEAAVDQRALHDLQGRAGGRRDYAEPV